MTPDPRGTVNAVNAPATRPALPPTWSPGSSSLSADSYRSGATTTMPPGSSSPGASSSGPSAPEPQRYAPAQSYNPSYEVPAAQPSVTIPPRDDSGAGFTPRVARLTVASIDPFSVLKLSFLLSVAAGVALVVAAVVLWMVLKGIGVFDQLNNLFGKIGGLDTAQDKFDIYDYVGLSRVISISVVIAVVDVVLLTALSTVSAFLYNLGAGLVGGVRVTLSDD